nr:ABC transporter permease subunit [Sphingomonas sp. Y57]
MIRHIMKHEWMLLSRERILYIAIPIYALLICYGVAIGTNWKGFLHTSSSNAVGLADAGFKSKLEKMDRIISGKDPETYFEDPRVAAPLARYKGYEMATKPPAPTAAIAIGQSDVLPSYLKVQWKPMFKQSNTDELENPKNLAIGAFDLSFVLIYLYPLLIIALSYNILSSERENGTQALLLSQPVSVGQFVLGKILLRGAIIIGLAVGISIVGLLIANPEIIVAGDLWRVLVLAVVLLAYGVFWFGLAVLVNAFGKRSSANALALMGIWIALVLIVPACLNLIAKVAHPLPSRIEMVQALRRGDRVAETQSNFSRSYRSDLLRKSEEEALAASNADFYAKVLPLEEKGEAIARPIFTEFRQQKHAQQAFTENLKFLSPAIIAQTALSELANQSSANFEAFNAQVEAYHEKWRQYFLPAVMTNRLLTREEFLAIPRFRYQPESNGVVAKRLLGDLFGLILFAGLAVAVGFNLLRRYPAAGR